MKGPKNKIRTLHSINADIECVVRRIGARYNYPSAINNISEECAFEREVTKSILVLDDVFFFLKVGWVRRKRG
jgi:hypothetical protein